MGYLIFIRLLDKQEAYAVSSYVVENTGSGRAIRTPDPCAQGGFRYPAKMPYFQGFLMQADVGHVLRASEPRGTLRLFAASIPSTSRRLAIAKSNLQTLP